MPLDLAVGFFPEVEVTRLRCVFADRKFRKRDSFYDLRPPNL